MLRRFGRLWPLHITVLAALVGLEGFKWILASRLHMTIMPFSGSDSLGSIFSNALLMQSLSIHSQPTWNLPSWSISTEFWTYLGFAGLCLFWRRPPIGLVIAIVVVAASLIFWFLPGLETNGDYALVRCIYGFCVGHLVYRFWHRSDLQIQGAFVLEIVASTIVFVFVFFDSGDAWSLSAPFIFGFAVWVFAQERGRLSTILSTSPFTQLGRWSYSIYMVHWLVLTVIARAANMILPRIGSEADTTSFAILRTTVCSGPWQANAFLVIYLAIVVTLASLTFQFIEQPGRRFFYRLADRFEIKYSRRTF